jgi:hypothetical protein
MNNSATVDPTKNDESKSASKKDIEPASRSDTALEMINKLLPRICESELGKACEVSVNLHLFIPPSNNVWKSKSKPVGSPSPNGK